ncbi:alpha/beta hydrolase [bacterium]|nr:alpha/beta hydrolase [bacterium]
MDLDTWRAGGRIFLYRGLEVLYRDEGDGPALLCIHGFPSASWDWHKLWPALTARFRVIAPDMLGFGLSAKPIHYAYSLRDQADLHEALLTTLGVASVDVLAHDYGDSVAQELLARQRERRDGLRLRSVCFLNGGLFPECHRPRPAQTLLRSPLGPLLARLISERRFAAGFAEVFGPHTRPSPDELHTVWLLNREHDGLRVAPKLIRYLDERRQQRQRWVEALQHSPVPLRFVNGAEDPVSGRHMADRYREIVPAPDVVLLEGIGHYPQLEAPQRVLDAFLPFVATASR